MLSPTDPARWVRALARPLVLLAVTALAVTAVAACGSSPTGTSDTALFGSTRQQECTAVAAVLSDGPDPTADPVGYAQAQVLPLRQLKLSITGLRKAVANLADAYDVLAHTPTTANTTQALRVSKAEAAVNAICPRAAN